MIREIATSLAQLDRLHQLNLELLEQLDVTCEWLLDSGFQIPNANKLKSLLSKANTLLTEIYDERPSTLLFSKPSDGSYHVSSNRRKVNRTDKNRLLTRIEEKIIADTYTWIEFFVNKQY
jgi:hypothetical protein